MRSTGLLCRCLAGFVLWAVVAPLDAQTSITVLTVFDRLPDQSTVAWMEQEEAELFSDAGLAFSWQLKQDHFAEVIGPMVSVQFHGKCRLEPSAILPATDGPLARIQVQDGEIWPAIEVDCDRTAAMVWQNRGTLPGPLVTRAFGRALGRVVAHELYHYVTQSAIHSASELFSRAMSSRDLTLPELRFESGEIEALRKGASRLGGTARPVGRIPATE